MHIFSGLIGVVVGFFVIKYSIPLTDSLGRIDFAEKYFRGGMAGTYSFYRICGVIIIILSFMYMFGILNLILGPVSGLFGAGQVPQ